MGRNKIGFLGEGWGGLAAFKSIKKVFDVELLTTDKIILASINEFTEVKNVISEFSGDVILCAGYKPIMNLDTLQNYDIVNIHYSLLPAYRGLHSTAWAIMNGEKKLGLTIHKMNPYIDDGSIIHQKEFLNDQLSSATHYMELMNNYILENCGNILNDYINGKITTHNQNKKNASWVGKRSQKHNFIDFTLEFEFCKRLYRILQEPYPNPLIQYQGSFYNVGNVAFHPSSVNTDIARILNNDNEGVWVKSKEGYIILNKITLLTGETVDNKIFKIGKYLNDRI